MKNKPKLATYLLIALVTTLSGCAYSTREDSAAFAVKHSGKIAKEDVSLFSDCMLDGLNPLGGKMFNPRTVRQQVRSSMIRLDILGAGGTIQTASVDIFKNGNVQFLINTNSSMRLVTYAAETEAFNKCLATFHLNE